MPIVGRRSLCLTMSDGCFLSVLTAGHMAGGMLSRLEKKRRWKLGALCRFMWNGQKPGEWRSGQMGELSSDEVGPGDKVFDAAIAACPSASASFLKRSIHRFDSAVVLACLETVADARKMLGDRSAEALEGCTGSRAGSESGRCSPRSAGSFVAAHRTNRRIAHARRVSRRWRRS